MDCAKASKNKNLYPYLLVMVNTGMRPSEAAGFKWGDVDLDARLVKLQITKTDKRYVPLTETAENTLRSLRPGGATKNMYVFLPKRRINSTLATYVPYHYFKRSFTTARTKAGLKDVQPP